jgi:hypothetical protein
VIGKSWSNPEKVKFFEKNVDIYVGEKRTYTEEKKSMPGNQLEKKEAHNMRYIFGLVKTVIKPRKSVSAYILFREIGMNYLDALKGVALSHATELIKLPG